MQIQVAVSGFLTPFGYEALTVGTTAVGLTASKYRITGTELARDQGNARVVMIQIEGRVRYRIDGGAATGTDGHILNDGDILTLGSYQQFKNLSMIRVSTEVSDATARVTYMR
jgi:hypothetical protein